MSNNATKHGARGLASVDWDDVHPDTSFYLEWLKQVKWNHVKAERIQTYLIRRWMMWEEAGADAYYAAMQPFEFKPGQKCVFLDAITENRRAVIHAKSSIHPVTYADFCRKFGMNDGYTRIIAQQCAILDQAITWIDLMQQGAQPSELLAGWEARKKLLGDDWNKPDYAQKGHSAGKTAMGFELYKKLGGIL